MSFSKPIPESYQSDPRLLGSGCKKYSVQRRSSASESHDVLRSMYQIQKWLHFRFQRKEILFYSLEDGATSRLEG